MTSAEVQYIWEVVDRLLDIRLANFGKDNTPERESFRKEIQTVINRYARDITSDTPDFILAQYLDSCLIAFDCAVQQREKWYGRDSQTTAGKPSDPHET